MVTATHTRYHNILPDFLTEIYHFLKVHVYYHIEPEGEKRLEQLLKDYYQVTKSIEKILNFDFSNLEET